ncbi:MAG: hypothetical protein A3E98_03220 [Candidatus Doudnabacteria bacterium RIFCSPHIGHO2_12_FULL_48_11]|uniref:Uncharacterized protein n=1 Tax=Candidatus Doudnabacteria bacterium RIFCSPHIGHO2_01_FULL_46_24 TaxID=1817825 RepID=A0A1F5NV98_9BACT|nr:MAG: hypothetical protein A2720_03380 [Candidatus Doudnabacteria bacterium RIFCSPHIGHO2_01_FULL_46_24]OGE95804.1 MAG: hypothetical protein A3E98_03220 [Candidatus Doudnabacteria bacterium RIFCSPHIGHO2_12_FULL_48_11]
MRNKELSFDPTEEELDEEFAGGGRANHPELIDDLFVAYGENSQDLNPEADGLVNEIVETAREFYEASSRKEEWNEVLEAAEELIMDFSNLYSEEDKQARIRKVRKLYQGLVH